MLEIAGREADGVIADDAQIHTWRAHKRRAKHGETPGAHITLTDLEKYGTNTI